MMSNLRVSIVQSKLHWEDKAANLAMFDQKLAFLKGNTDLVVLPEMFTTGFSMHPAALAEGIDGETVHWMKQKAKELGAVVTGSFICKENDLFFNRLIWMQPNGEYQSYDKRHLFSLAGEHHHYKAGEKKQIVEWKGWKICPLICYDLRFPVWSRNVEDYDLLIYVANFPEKRKHAWESLLVARSIENQCFTIGINRVGTDGNDIYYSGDSLLLDYNGQLLHKVSHIENISTTEISLKKQEAFREKLNFLPDRDAFDILY